MDVHIIFPKFSTSNFCSFLEPKEEGDVNLTRGGLCGEIYTNLLCSTAASTNEANSGCGANGRDFSSG
jgi:hypothetical protein